MIVGLIAAQRCMYVTEAAEHCVVGMAAQYGSIDFQSRWTPSTHHCSWTVTGHLHDTLRYTSHAWNSIINIGHIH